MSETPAAPEGSAEPASPHISDKVGRFTKNGFILALITASSCIAAVSTFTTASISVHAWYTGRYNWQTGEYKRLQLIRAGYTLEKFREQLGEPSYQSTRMANLGYASAEVTDSIFQRHGYWVDAVAKANVVIAYSVTSCQADFNPSISYWGGESQVSLTLNRTPVSGVYNNSGAQMKAFPRVASANKYIFEIQFGGNATFYRTHAWGLNDACAWQPIKDDLLNAWNLWTQNLQSGQVFEFSKLDATARDLAAKSLINTYAETAPGVSFDVYPNQIGIDRTVVR